MKTKDKTRKRQSGCYVGVSLLLLLLLSEANAEVGVVCNSLGYSIPSEHRQVLGEQTYYRADGVCRPLKEAVLFSSNWPYTIADNGDTITLSRKGRSITLPAPTWLNYDFGLDRVGLSFQVNSITVLQERSTVYNSSCRYVSLGNAPWVKLARYTYGDFSWDEHFQITDSNESVFENGKGLFRVVNQNLYFLECDTQWFVTAVYPVHFDFNSYLINATNGNSTFMAGSYSNTSSEIVDNALTLFDLDDFNDSSINSRWVGTPAAGSFTESGGLLRVNGSNENTIIHYRNFTSVSIYVYPDTPPSRFDSHVIYTNTRTYTVFLYAATQLRIWDGASTYLQENSQSWQTWTWTHNTTHVLFLINNVVKYSKADSSPFTALRIGEIWDAGDNAVGYLYNWIRFTPKNYSSSVGNWTSAEVDAGAGYFCNNVSAYITNNTQSVNLFYSDNGSFVKKRNAMMTQVEYDVSGNYLRYCNLTLEFITGNQTLTAEVSNITVNFASTTTTTITTTTTLGIPPYISPPCDVNESGKVLKGTRLLVTFGLTNNSGAALDSQWCDGNKTELGIEQIDNDTAIEGLNYCHWYTEDDKWTVGVNWTVICKGNNTEGQTTEGIAQDVEFYTTTTTVATTTTTTVTTTTTIAPTTTTTVATTTTTLVGDISCVLNVPADSATVSPNVTQDFNVTLSNSSNVTLDFVGIYMDWGGVWQLINYTETPSLGINSFQYNLTDVGTYVWACYANTTNRTAYTSENRTLYVAEGGVVGSGVLTYMHWQMLGIGGVLFTSLGFCTYFERIGRLMFLFLASIDWLIMSLATMRFKVIWDAGKLLNYTFIPVNGEEALALIPGFFGVLLILITYYHTVDWMAYQPMKEGLEEAGV